MNLFTRAIDAATNQTSTPKKETWTEKVQRLNAEAMEMEKEVLVRNSELFFEAVTEERKQREGYFFSCSRFGQFLTINVVRSANISEEEKELAFSINLNKVNTILLRPGRSTDCKGELSYYRHSNTIAPRYPTIPVGRTLFGSGSGRTNLYFPLGYGETAQPTYKTKGIFRPSVDDEIEFQDISKSLYVPFGLGEKVYKLIIEAKA